MRFHYLKETSLKVFVFVKMIPKVGRVTINNFLFKEAMERPYPSKGLKVIILNLE